MRSDTAFFSAAVISRRFLCGLTSGWLSAEAAAAFLGEERRDAERAAGAEASRSCSTSVSALISAWRRSISPCRSAIACAMTLMVLENNGPATGMRRSTGVGKVRAAALMQTFGAEPVGNQRTLPADEWSRLVGESNLMV